ncbi:MAG TPA: glycosyltransferase [Stellaceae bacterium]|nr:glycosyltransferase [Stellaceae bacterium]
MNVLGIVGRMTDIVLVTLLLSQALLGFQVVRTLVQHIRYRREGMRREREMLAWPLPLDEELPAVLVQIPTYNEGMLIRRVLDAVVALDWPRDRLAVQVLDDSTGTSAELARSAVAEYRAEGHKIELLQRTDRTGFKAGALKAGLSVTDQPFIAVFDADYVPPPDFLRKCLRPLLAQPNLAFAQARCDFLNASQNWVTRAQEVILDSHYAVEQPTRSWTGEFLPFNGTCGVWRRKAIEAAGGWHGDTLTEDLDLSYRAQLAGWRAVYLASVAAPGELPDVLATWQRQQLRWNKGFAQTARKLLPGIVIRSRLPWRDRAVAVLHLGGCTYGVLMGCTIAVWLLDAALGTITYSIVVPLAVFDSLQGCVGAIGLAVASRTLLRSLGVKRATEGLLPVIKVALRTLWMHAYAGFMTARGVLEGARGRHSLFGRTPKRGSGLDADDAGSARMPL